jgi:phospholipase C
MRLKAISNSLAPRPTPAMAEDDPFPDSYPIHHVVVLMLENHSFDQMLGDYQSKYKELDGIDPAAVPRTNIDTANVEYPQAPTPSETKRVPISLRSARIAGPR